VPPLALDWSRTTGNTKRGNIVGEGECQPIEKLTDHKNVELSYFVVAVAVVVVVANDDYNNDDYYC